MVRKSKFSSERDRSSQRSKSESTDKTLNFSLNISQGLVLSFAIAGVMLATFLVGLYAGRSQGVAYALKSYGQEAVRIPAPRAVRPENSQISTSEIASGITRELIQPAEKPGASEGIDTASNQSGNVRYDFSNSLVPRVDQDEKGAAKKTEAAAGFAAKPAGVQPVVSTSRARMKAKPSVQKKRVVQSEKARQAAAVSKAKSGEKRAPAAAKMAAASTKPAAKKTSTKRSKTVINSEEQNGGIARGWYVQAGAYRKKAEAARVTSRLDTRGVTSQVQQAVVRSKRFYRVLLGPYGTKQKAEAAITRLKSLKVSSGEPFLRQIK